MSKLKNERQKYVQERLSAVQNKPTELKRIAKELFLSERTIRRDAGMK